MGILPPRGTSILLVRFIMHGRDGRATLYHGQAGKPVPRLLSALNLNVRESLMSSLSQDFQGLACLGRSQFCRLLEGLTRF